MRNFLFIITLFAFGFSLTASAQNVEAKLDSLVLYVGDQTAMTITVKSPKGKVVQMPQLKKDTYICDGVEIVDIEKDDTTETADELQITRKLYLTSFDENAYKIPAQEVKIGGKVYKTNPLALKVLTLDVDTVHLDKYFPQKDIQDNPFLWSEWQPLLILLLAMFVLMGLGYYLYDRLKKNKPIIAKIKIVKFIPAHQKALKAIDKLKSERLPNTGKQKEYYTQLTDTLRLYIEERFGFSAMEMTSDEIIRKLNETGDSKMISELRELFTTADLVKFAKYETLINENDMNLVNAINFIDQTKTEEVEREERVMPTLSDDDKKKNETRMAVEITLYTIGAGCVMIFIYLIYRAISLIG